MINLNWIKEYLILEIIFLLFYFLIPTFFGIKTYLFIKKYRHNLINMTEYDTKNNTNNSNLSQYMLSNVNAIKNNEIWFDYKDKIYKIDKNSCLIYILTPDGFLQNRLKNFDVILNKTYFMLIGDFYLSQNFTIKNKNRYMFCVICENSENIIENVIRHCRIKNYYWNEYTMPSLITGSFLLLINLLINIHYSNTIYNAVCIILSIIPYLPLVPPGVIIYFLYKKLINISNTISYKIDIMRYNNKNRNIIKNFDKKILLLKIQSYFVILFSLIFFFISIIINSFLILFLYITLIN